MEQINILAASFVEVKAKEALNYPPFRSINLENIKAKVQSILGMIGRDKIFDQYTKHDISHINKMFELLSWIIPVENKTSMTYADYLMLTLAVYFHDLGMLVTRDEYESRSGTSFKEYKEQVLQDEFGADFKKKILSLGDSGSEEFLYQEFVRINHAKRIKAWILGKDFKNVGCSNSIVLELANMLNDLDSAFKKDLAFVCESHHLDDLGDVSKYKINAAYGSSAQESANLQYIAVLLRTVDLLHITADRTPSIEFRLINPNDPISQLEWHKQMAVKSVRKKPKLSKDGIVNNDLQSDTVEVVAYFDNPNKAESFFGLINYLNYAKKQLKKSYEWIELSNKKFATNLIFSWREIDDSLIETEGFERKLFEFVLDQNKILNLLVGHTLYNDSTVVLRELIQNSIDAIRYYNYSKENANPEGEILIEWDEAERTLKIIDQGIGMNLDTIENFLLKVGSSRYQDETFKKANPDFFSISRFGIGILTCFLISDEIDITTTTEEDTIARRISIRNLDGKYLLQNLSKESLQTFQNHGTEIKLKVRHDAEMINLKQDVQNWIVLPPCPVRLSMNGELSAIGFKTPKEALIYQLKTLGWSEQNQNIKIVEEEKDGINIAYALRFNKYYREWEFFSHRYYTEPFEVEDQPLIGTCIEGVRVEFTSPGYDGINIFAFANIAARYAPKTNVARSHFESNKEYNFYLKVIYDIYCSQISSQINDLYKNQNFSLSWSINEAAYLIVPILSDDTEKSKAINRDLLLNSLDQIPCALIEENNVRSAKNVSECNRINEFWIPESDMFKTAEVFLRAISENTSITGLLDFISLNNITKQISTIFNGFNPRFLLHQRILENKEVTEIIINEDKKEIFTKWVAKKQNKWFHHFIGHTSKRRSHQNNNVYIQLSKETVLNIKDYSIVYTYDQMFILRGSQLHSALMKLIDAKRDLKDHFDTVFDLLLSLAIKLAFRYNIESLQKHIRKEVAEQLQYHTSEELFYQQVPFETLTSLISELPGQIYDLRRGKRKASNLDGDYEEYF